MDTGHCGKGYTLVTHQLSWLLKQGGEHPIGQGLWQAGSVMHSIRWQGHISHWAMGEIHAPALSGLPNDAPQEWQNAQGGWGMCGCCWSCSWLHLGGKCHWGEWTWVLTQTGKHKGLHMWVESVCALRNRCLYWDRHQKLEWHQCYVTWWGTQVCEYYILTLPLLFLIPPHLFIHLPMRLLIPGTALLLSPTSLIPFLLIPLISSLALPLTPLASLPCYVLGLIPLTALLSSTPTVLTGTLQSFSSQPGPTRLVSTL